MLYPTSVKQVAKVVHWLSRSITFMQGMIKKTLKYRNKKIIMISSMEVKSVGS